MTVVTSGTMVKVVATWDSGPYGIYYLDESTGVDVPVEVYERWEKASSEFMDAQEALEAALRAAKEAR